MLFQIVCFLTFKNILKIIFFRSLNFVYPFGATLNVVKPAVPVLSSGTVSLPVNRPICAFHASKVKIHLVFETFTWEQNIFVFENSLGNKVSLSLKNSLGEKYMQLEICRLAASC